MCVRDRYFEDADEVCPHCGNCYVIVADTPATRKALAEQEGLKYDSSEDEAQLEVGKSDKQKYEEAHGLVWAGECNCCCDL